MVSCLLRLTPQIPANKNVLGNNPFRIDRSIKNRLEYTSKTKECERNPRISSEIRMRDSMTFLPAKADKNQGSHQFLNWWQRYATGISHLIGSNPHQVKNTQPRMWLSVFWQRMRDSSKFWCHPVFELVDASVHWTLAFKSVRIPSNTKKKNHTAWCGLSFWQRMRDSNSGISVH